MTPKEQIIYDMLAKAAERGDQCPSNAVLAVAIGANSISGPVRYVNDLAAKGIIRVERSQRFRIVTIVATGKSTAKPHDKYIAAQHNTAAARRDRLAELVSEGMTQEAAARAMGLSIQRIRQIWREICDGLGWLG